MPTGTPKAATLKATVPAATIAATQDQVIGESPVAGTVIGVSFTPEAALTAHGTDYRTFKVVNKGQAGAGTTAVATFATDTVTTDDLVAFDEKAIPLSATAADLVVAEGDILAAVETVAGNGIAHSGYQIVVEIARS